MRVGSKGRYAVIALVDVAGNAGRRPVALAEVAERQHISLSYLEQLFAMLRRSGLVISSRGPGGGYRLARAAEAITVGEVFRAVEEPVPVSDGARDWRGGGGPTTGLWAALDDHIREFLEGLSVADVLAGKVNGTSVNGSGASAAGGLSATSKLA